MKILHNLDDDTNSKSHRSFDGRHNRSDRNSRTDINALNAVVCHLKKPVSELQKFEGDSLLYHRLMRQFRGKFEANRESPDERFNYFTFKVIYHW